MARTHRRTPHCENDAQLDCWPSRLRSPQWRAARTTTIGPRHRPRPCLRRRRRRARTQDQAPAGESAPSARPLALGECAGPPGKRLRTLVVGNSQIYFWDLPKILSDLSESAPAECARIDAEAFTQSGQKLRHLWTNGDSMGRNLPAQIRDGSPAFADDLPHARRAPASGYRRPAADALPDRWRGARRARARRPP